VALDDLGDGRGCEGGLVPGLLALLEVAGKGAGGRGVEGPPMEGDRGRAGSRLGGGAGRGGRRVHEHRGRGRGCAAAPRCPDPEAAAAPMMRRHRARGWGGWDFLAAYSGPGGGRWGTGPGDGFIRTVASATRATARAKKNV
jgi:hypothetical protein